MPRLEQQHDLLEAAERSLAARQLASACRLFDRAERVGCDANRCAAGRWMVHMLRGEMELAWRDSDAIRARTGFESLWQGEPIDGKRVMLRCLHGLGDAVQFLRYAPLLKERADQLIVEVPPAMVELAHCFAGVDHVITWGDGAPAIQPEWDVQVEINELAYLFRTRLADLPLATNYLRTHRHKPARAVQAGALRVGLVWASSEWDGSRSLSLRDLESVTSIAGCEFWNLQGGTARAEWQSGRGAVFHDAEDCADSVAALAELIGDLDLVITTDTLAAHLAGAQGTPAWVMLQHAADWRWMHARDESPWYPSLRLFRQPKAGDWAAVMAAMAQALRGLRAAGSRRLVA